MRPERYASNRVETESNSPDLAPHELAKLCANGQAQPGPACKADRPHQVLPLKRSTATEGCALMAAKVIGFVALRYATDDHFPPSLYALYPGGFFLKF